jgi:ferrous iron transport protein A
MPEILPLHLLPTGQSARIDQLVGGTDEVHRLQELGMRIGTDVEMLQRGTPCIIRLNGARLAFRQHDNCRVLVRLGAAG